MAETFETQELILEGVLCVADGLHPSLIRRKLGAFLRQPLTRRAERQRVQEGAEAHGVAHGEGAARRDEENRLEDGRVAGASAVAAGARGSHDQQGDAGERSSGNKAHGYKSTMESVSGE